MKKLKTLFLTVAVLIPALACGSYAFAEETVYKEDIFTYTVSGGQATITNVDDVRETVVIPEQLDGNTVVALASGACGGSKIIREITLADTITAIGSMCFASSTAQA